MNSLITRVQLHSKGETAGITAGDRLVSVNGCVPKDIIELSFLVADTNIQVIVENPDGQRRTHNIVKSADEKLGLEFATAVFDGVSRCHNGCVFCFVDQMLPGLRETLYVRDDDFRLSFLYGNFITLTNMRQEDYDRIIRTHMSPLYISVHATDAQVRASMMRNNKAGLLMSNLQRLAKANIEIHTQIVLCPGYNDGEVLEKTFQDLSSLYPAVQTMAVVPVGLTKNRTDLTNLRLFTSSEADNLIAKVSKWQDKCRQAYGKTFVYLGDEFYVTAGRRIPPAEYYDGFPQLENGIGLTRNFIDSWNKRAALANERGLAPASVIPVGTSAYRLLLPLIQEFNAKYKTEHTLLPVINNFFGSTINVTGLLTSVDIIEALRAKNAHYKRIILPGSIINKDFLFLDDVSLEAFKSQVAWPVAIAEDADSLYKILLR